MEEEREEQWRSSPPVPVEVVRHTYGGEKGEDVIMSTGDFGKKTCSNVPALLEHITKEKPTSLALSERHTTSNNNTSTRNRPNILRWISDDALWAEIFAHVGAVGTARCARVCRSWHRLVQAPSPSWSIPSLSSNSEDLDHSDVWLWTTSQALWRQLVQSSYAGLAETAAADFATDRSGHGQSKQNNSSIDWRAVYSYIATQERTQRRRRLQARVVFADDGTHFPGYPPSHALREDRTVWCTSPGVDRNVDLVVQFVQDDELLSPLSGCCALIESIYASNGGRGYSAPLKEALVFASMDRPDLEAARTYDGDCGSQWVQYLEALERQEARRRHGGGCKTNDIADPINTTKNDALDRAAAPTVEIPAALRRWTEAISTRERSSTDDDIGGDNSVETCARTTAIEYKRRPETPLTPPTTTSASGTTVMTPISGFQFPTLPHAYEAALVKQCGKPTVGVYLHFKLLSSYKRPDLMELSDNIDVQQLHAFGIALPGLPQLLGLHGGDNDYDTSTNTNSSGEPMGPTLYRRMHAVRPPRFLWDDRREDGNWMDDDQA